MLCTSQVLTTPAYGAAPDDSFGPGGRTRIAAVAVNSRGQERKDQLREKGTVTERTKGKLQEERDRSSSVGTTNRGRLRGSVLLPATGVGFILRSRHGFGTKDTIRYIEYASRKISLEYEGSVPVVVGAISRKGGGKLRHHKSHQSGRDADIGYYKKGNTALRLFRRMNGRILDAEKSWAYLEALLATGAVQYIFVDYRLQKYLRRAAENMGWPAAELDRIFQYPKGRKSRTGVIRHSSGHHDHFHVRFGCPAGHRRCWN